MSNGLEYPRDVFSRVFNLSNDGDAVLVKLLLDSVFFASLMTEEGQPVPIGVIYEDDSPLEKVFDDDPDSDLQAWSVCRIQEIDCSPINLKRLAHGVEYGRDLVIISVRDHALKITGIARLRPHSDGGSVLRIAAPRPGVLVLEARNEQLCARYEAGAESPTKDINVFREKGPVLSALRKCGLGEFLWELAEALRYARLAGSGAMFFCVNEKYQIDLQSERLTYRFVNPTVAAPSASSLVAHVSPDMLAPRSSLLASATPHSAWLGPLTW